MVVGLVLLRLRYSLTLFHEFGSCCTTQLLSGITVTVFHVLCLAPLKGTAGFYQSIVEEVATSTLEKMNCLEQVTQLFRRQ